MEESVFTDSFIFHFIFYFYFCATPIPPKHFKFRKSIDFFRQMYIMKV